MAELDGACCSTAELNGTRKRSTKLDEHKEARQNSVKLDGAWQSSMDLDRARRSSAVLGDGDFTAAASNYLVPRLLIIFKSFFIFIHHYNAFHHFVMYKLTNARTNERINNASYRARCPGEKSRIRGTSQGTQLQRQLNKYTCVDLALHRKHIERGAHRGLAELDGAR